MGMSLDSSFKPDPAARLGLIKALLAMEAV